MTVFYTQHEPGTLEYWLYMVKGSICGITEDQALEIAKIALKENCGTWHAGFLYAKDVQKKLDAKCWCSRCKPGQRLF